MSADERDWYRERAAKTMRDYYYDPKEFRGSSKPRSSAAMGELTVRNALIVTTRASPKRKHHDGFLVHHFFVPDPIHHPLPSLCEKVKDCGTTTGHVGFPAFALTRALMKDARRGLNR